MEGDNTTERGGEEEEGKESARISHFPKVGTAFGFPERERRERERERGRLLSQDCEPLTNLLFLVHRTNVTEHSVLIPL